MSEATIPAQGPVYDAADAIERAPRWPEPVGWMTPGGDISRSLKWCTERCLPNDYRLEALYTRAQVEVMVCAQEARRVEMLRKLGARLAGLLDEDQFAECEALLLAAGVLPEPTFENVKRRMRWPNTTM